MENKKDILNGLRKSQRPTVPDGFYDQFWSDLMERIQNESGILGQLKKTEKPAIPEDFFANLTSSITAEEPTFSVDELQKREKPTLPVNYFDQSTEQIMAAVKAEEKKKGGKVINMRLVTIISAVAAAIAIIFTVINFSGPTKENGVAYDEIPKDSIPQEVISTEDDYDDYLAYLDEDEIIDYIIENDIEIEDSTEMVEYEDYFDFSEEDIEDYYFDLL